MQPNRLPGVSFVLRARNEEAYIARAITSLSPLSIHYEIIVVLHKCTDASKEIAQAAQSAQPLIIYQTDQSLSRAGYENVVTPPSHPASICHFYNEYFSKSKYQWIFKWDADFVATAELIHFLNHQLDLSSRTPVRYRICCLLGDKRNCEQYLSNCLIKFTKHIFWEVPVFDGNSTVVDAPDNVIIHSIPSTVLKSYWKEPRWFENDGDDLEKKYQLLVALCGPEKEGSARAQCTDGDDAYRIIRQNETYLRENGIEIW